MKLQPDGVVVEPAARQPGPLDGVLAFLDVLFRRAALIVKGDDALSIRQLQLSGCHLDEAPSGRRQGRVASR